MGQSDHAASLQRIKSDLEAIGCEFVLIGGLALGFYIEPRTTRDVDLAISVATDADAMRVVRTLLQTGYQAATENWLLEHKVSNLISTVRLTQPVAGPQPPGAIIDLLFARSGIEKEIVTQANSFEFPDVGTVRVAALHHLIATKTLSARPTRPQDQVDLTNLLRAANRGDLQRAFEALALVTERGYNRGKDLASDLRSIVRLHAPEISDEPGNDF